MALPLDTGASAGPNDPADGVGSTGAVATADVVDADGSAASGRGRRPGPRPADLVAMLLPTAVLAVMGWQRRWMTDDGLIFTRVVRQIVEGNGPVYNVGERAETSTSTAWQWLLVAAHWVTPFRDAETAVYLGLVLSVAGFWTALNATRRLFRTLSASRFLLPAGALVFVAVQVNWDFLTAGMEMGLALLWIGVSWALLVTAWDTPRGELRRRRLVGTSFWYGLGPMVRPDLGLTAVVFLAVLAALTGARVRLWRRQWRRWGLMASAAGALPVAYEIFRMGYYGLLVPMPAVTKEAGDSPLLRGWEYLVDYERPYRIWIPLLLLAGAAAALLRHRKPDSRTRALVAAPLLAAFLQALYVVKVGGDFMHGRMMLPVVFLLLLPLLLVPFDKLATPLVAGVAVWALVCGATVRADGITTFSPHHRADRPRYQVWNERWVYKMDTGEANPVSAQAHIQYLRSAYDLVRRAAAEGRRVMYFDPGYMAKKGLPADFSLPLRPGLDSSAVLVIGRLGLGGAIVPLGDGRVADQWGLANTIGAHIEQTGRTAAGHQKFLPDAWNIALYADPASFASVPPALATQEQIDAAYRVLGCGPVKDLVASVTEPMGFGRFWENLTGAWGRTNLRLPSDPVAAERKFCH